MTKIKIITLLFVTFTSFSCVAKLTSERDDLEGSVSRGAMRRKMQQLGINNAPKYAEELCDRIVRGKLGSRESVMLLANHPMYKTEEQRINGQAVAKAMERLMADPTDAKAIRRLKKITRAQERAKGLHQYLNEHQGRMYQQLRKKRHQRPQRDLQNSLFVNPLPQSVREAFAVATPNPTKHRRNVADFFGATIPSTSISLTHQDGVEDLTSLGDFEAQAPILVNVQDNNVTVPTPTTPGYFQSIWQTMSSLVRW